MKHFSSISGRPKQRFSSHTVATEAAKRRTRESGVPYGSYPCACGFWHIGRIGRTYWNPVRQQKVFDEFELGRRVAAHLQSQNEEDEQRRMYYIRKLFASAKRKGIP